MKACVISNAQLARPQVYKVHPLASPEAAEQDKKIHEIHDRVLTQHAIRHTVAVHFLVFLVASIYNRKPFDCSVLNTTAFRVPRNRFITKEEVFSQAKIAIGGFREDYDDDKAQKWTATNGAADDEAAMERPTRGRTPGQKARPTAAQTRARRNQTQKRGRAEERALANMPPMRPRGRPRKTFGQPATTATPTVVVTSGRRRRPQRDAPRPAAATQLQPQQTVQRACVLNATHDITPTHDDVEDDDVIVVVVASSPSSQGSLPRPARLPPFHCKTKVG
ncbi:hypothetical protein CEUSTIGMA_g7122.t1 [Chlamydomonas eustigma]|uniref:Uncharacterized protein n=1 Tax=Chlamydomonas eustigma TaxID=1157962 RepID=A0A250X9D6_9CHLO|nr:hypothetical protein CEUSTIGMA_g7122.t1 [Chlamydomonas eustigma]|eukprot:GAX79681.1 hypothetical protein CEUSTIGMA_g7122.t1 [Chlamydomonas eustigma]